MKMIRWEQGGGTMVSKALLWCTACLLFVCVTGCPESTKTWTPYLDRPQRPALQLVTNEELNALSPSAREKVISNNEKLMLYARKLEVMIDDYNEWRTGKLKK
jgi:hypothetical protein